MRNKRLDVLRCIAVLLVLLYHSDVAMHLVGDGGWAGVDLFFVLSGFLISGLLFTEYKERKSISFQRFFIRRGLKLYPAFYFYILVMFLYQVVFHRTVGTPGQYLSEMLYVQNYGPFIWRHTWSLAVEEHFYLLLPLFLLILIRYAPNREDPFRVMPGAFLVVATACLALRVATVLRIPQAALLDWTMYREAYATTHCRIDSLFFGVLLGYFYHFRPETLDRLLGPTKNRIVLAFLSAALLSACLFIPIQSRFMLTAGLTLVYLGFGCVLMLCLRVQNVLSTVLATPLEQIGKGFAYVGMYSYSIYLWHTAFLGWGPGFVRHVFHTRPNAFAGFAIYLTVSITFGISMSRLIEYPVLRVRDQIFPALRGSPNTATSTRSTKPE
jgi:peptidoglycan/LPS O-acetylase OafA/YrhL